MEEALKVAVENVEAQYLVRLAEEINASHCVFVKKRDGKREGKKG